jgi:hypothetical protein
MFVSLIGVVCARTVRETTYHLLLHCVFCLQTMVYGVLSVWALVVMPERVVD